MEAEKVMQLFDSCWYELEIFKKQPRSSNSSTFEPNPDHQNEEETSKPEIIRIPTHHTRSMSDQLSSKTSFIDGCFSPDSVLLTPKLHTILSGKDITEENTTQRQTQIQESQKKKVTSRRNSRKKSISKTKSLSDLEFEELKGFMDLGFVFSEEDKDSRLVEIIPGLQRLGKKDGEEGAVVDKSTVSRPYLSEAWEVLDRTKRENPILMNWRIPTLSNEIDMKDNLRWWAHTVASAVR